MKIDSSALIYNLPKFGARGVSDPFAVAGSANTGTMGGSNDAVPPLDASQITSLSSPRSLAVQAEINAQLAAPSNDSAAESSGGPVGDSGGQNVHNMTNAQLVAYGKAHGLRDVVAHFDVDYAAVDNSMAGQSAMYQQLMSDPTKHDFVKDFTAAANWQAQHGASDGGASFLKMAAELQTTSAENSLERRPPRLTYGL